MTLEIIAPISDDAIATCRPWQPDVLGRLTCPAGAGRHNRPMPMMRRLVIIVAISVAWLGYPAYAGQDPAKALYGVWHLVAFQTQIIGEAAPHEPFGPHPFGYLILTPQHRMMAYLSKTDRKPPTNDAEAAKLLRSMIAYTGKFRLEGDKFITTVDGAWNEILKANEQVRYFSIEDDKLTIRTAEQPSGVYPGKRIVSTLTWEREQ